MNTAKSGIDFSDFSNKRIHMIGVKGTGMAALAEILVFRGARVTGSDIADVFYTDSILHKIGISPSLFDACHITDDIELVIYSAAYNETNPEFSAAAKKNIPMLVYPEALGKISEKPFSVGIAGVHGKTSTTGLTGILVKQFPELAASVLAGSGIPGFSDDASDTVSCTHLHGDAYFVAETCEYKRHFMHFSPNVIVLTSVESDHQDFYPTFADIQNAFIDYIELLPKNGVLIFCEDDAGAKETAEIAHNRRSDITMIPYGKRNITLGEITDGKQFFSLKRFDARFDAHFDARSGRTVIHEFALAVPGAHMVLNASAAVFALTILLQDAGIDAFSANSTQRIAAGLLQFHGAKRRSEIIGKHFIGEKNDTIFIDDYAHHPTAIEKTLAGFKAFYPDRKIIVDFMSHTYSRTKALFAGFSSCWTSADTVILHEIYASAREKHDSSDPTGKSLFEAVKKQHSDVHYFEKILDATDFAESLVRADGKKLFITMGAGDNWKLGAELLQRITDVMRH
ncbi:MAG: UDP-N-acetylmuramate--L-alanine ligase [Treponemataceae bacterium]|nr:MAG: UDP-N-acetylmuramate--L-alanine ligase [Treponemataceae bacterium]